MGSVFRRVRSPSWTITWRCNGKRREEIAGRDRRAAERLLAAREAEAGEFALAQRLIDSGTDAERERAADALLARLSPAARRRIGEALVASVETNAERARRLAHEQTRTTPLPELLDEFLQHRAANGAREPRRELLRTRLAAAFAGMRIESVADLDAARAEPWLLALVTERDRAPATRDAYALAMRSFGRWLETSGRWPSNPFAELKPIAKERDERRVRRALTAAEIDALLRHLQADATARGRDLALLVEFAAFTGLRRRELAALRWRDVDLEADVPTVIVPATIAKSGRTATVPLVARLVDRLQVERDRRKRERGAQPAPDAHVLRVRQRAAVQLRAAARLAGIVLDAGQTFDLHSLRATCGTLLAHAGVPVQTARRILRHADARTTDRHYSRVGLRELASELERVAVPTPSSVREHGREGVRDA